MTTPQAIFFSALVIAVSILASNGIQNAHASIKGPYMLERHSNPNANAGVFRIDTASGEVSYCFVTPNNELVCSKSVM